MATTFSKLKPRILSENVLFTVLLELTYRCNLDCFFCYNDRDQRGKLLSTAQYFKLLEELRDMQVLNLVLSGGEPLAHPDFFRIGAKARELGFVVRIKSNGHALNQRLATRLKNEVDPFAIDISLHGATAQVHDRQTRVPGSFEQLLKNIETLQTLGLRFRLNSTVTAWNEHEIAGMHVLAQKLGVPFNMSTSVTPRDNGDREPLDIAPSDEAITRVFELATAGKVELEGAEANGAARCGKPGQGEKICGTGSSTLTIDPVGNVLPCVQWRRPVGNLHYDSIQVLWGNSAELRKIRITAERAQAFVEGYGAGGKLMGYCIGEAVNQTGSAIGLYPGAKRHMANRLKLLIR